MKQYSWKNQPFLSFLICLCNIAFLFHLQVCGEKRNDIHGIYGFGALEMERKSSSVGVDCYRLSS